MKHFRAFAFGAALAALPVPPVHAAKTAAELPRSEESCRAEAYSLFIQGATEEMKSRPHQALARYREALALDPKAAHLHYKIGEMLFHIGSFQEAEVALKESLALEEARDTLVLLGRLYKTMAQQTPRQAQAKPLMEQAVESLRRAVEMGGEAGQAGVELAALYAGLGRHDEAEALLHRAMDENAGDAQPYLMLARIRGMQGRGDEARALLDRAMEADPGSPEAMRALAALHQEGERCDEAAPLLERLVEAMPLDFESRERLGWCYAVQRRYDMAAALLEPVVNVRPSFQAVFTLGLCYRELQAFDKAQALWLRFLRENPLHLKAREELGRVYAAMGDFAAALEQYGIVENDLLKQARKDPAARGGLAQILRARGILLLEMRQPEDAAAAFERAIQMDGADAAEEGYALALTAWIQAKNATKALVVVTEALSRFPKSATLRFALAEIYAFDTKLDLAFAEVEKILAAVAAGGEAAELDYLNAGGFFARNGRPERALDVLREAERRFPESDRVHFQLGATHERAGNFDDAVRHLSRAAELNPLNAPALNYLGYMLADKGVRLDEALEFTKRAVSLDSRNGAYLDSLGWAHFRLGNYAEAERCLADAVERMEDPVVREHLGDLHFALERYDKAVAEWKKSLEAGAENAKAVEEKIEKAERRLQGKSP